MACDSGSSMGRQQGAAGNGGLSPEDSAVAFFLSEAVQLGGNENMKDFLGRIVGEIPFVQFGEVHVSKDLTDDGFKFLVAHSTNTTFIAFRGSAEDFDDPGSDFLTATSTGGVKKRVLKLSKIFMGSDCNVVQQLSLSGNRIIFCGERLGGAVAHMVVLGFRTNYLSNTSVKKPSFNILSIAFGAPCICDSVLAGNVNANAHLKSHFFDFVHEEDLTAFQFHAEEVHEYEDSRLVQGGRVGCIVVGSAGGRRGYAGHTNVPFSSGASHLLAGIQKTSNNWMSNNVLSVRQGWSNSNSPEVPICHPIGNTTLLKGPKRSGSYGRRQWTREKFFDSYTSALQVVGVPPTCASNPSESDLELDVTTPAPRVTSVKWMASDSGSFIHVVGRNLLFLLGPVKLNGLVPLKTKVQTDTELLIDGPTQTDENTKSDLKLIVLETAFGSASHVIMEENLSDGTPTAVRRLLSKIVQIFVVLATPPMGFLPNSKVLEDLDSIVQCVPSPEDEKLSTLLRTIADGHASEEELQKNINQMNTMVKSVIEFLRRSYNIEYKDTLPVILASVAGGLLLAAGLILLPVSGVVYAFGGASTLFTTSVLASGGGVASGTVAIWLDKNKIMIPDYLEVLRTAIAEAKLWYDKSEDELVKPAEDVLECPEAALESLLQKHVECSGSYLTDRINEIHKKECEDIVFLSKLFEGATFESKKNLMRRMQIVAKTVSMYNTEVKNNQYVGIVGAEDAGKSTFIKKSIEKYIGKDAKDIPEVGIDVHTSRVRAYKLKNGLYLVDFPGSNGTGDYADAWKQFTSLSSSCILLLDFKNDVKKDQIKMYQEMEKDLDSRVMVVFNKVDEQFTPKKEAFYNAEYFIKQRINAATKLGCKIENVHFVCLDADPEERLTKLRKVGVLGFEELAKIVLGLNGI